MRGGVRRLIAGKYAALSPFLDERQRRLWLAAEAHALGRGGVSVVQTSTKLVP